MSKPLIQKVKEIIDIVYPVGSVYISVNSTSPATLFGGTWAQLKDRFLIGAGSSYSNGATGGGTANDNIKVSSIAYGLVSEGVYNGQALVSITKNNTTSAAYLKDVGINILPPYLAVYMWKRTA